jgi:hypothetical protein
VDGADWQVPGWHVRAVALPTGFQVSAGGLVQPAMPETFACFPTVQGRIEGKTLYRSFAFGSVSAGLRQACRKCPRRSLAQQHRRCVKLYQP